MHAVLIDLAKLKHDLGHFNLRTIIDIVIAVKVLGITLVSAEIALFVAHGSEDSVESENIKRCKRRRCHDFRHASCPEATRDLVQKYARLVTYFCFLEILKPSSNNSLFISNLTALH